MIKFPHLLLYPMGGGGIFIRSCIRDLLGYNNGYDFSLETNEFFCGARLNSNLTSIDENVIIWNNRYWNEYEFSNMNEKITATFAKSAPDTSLGNIAVHTPPAIFDNIDYKSNVQLMLDANDDRIQWCAELAIYKRDDTSKANFRWDRLELRKELTERWKKAACPIIIDFDDFYENQNIQPLIDYCNARNWKVVANLNVVKDKIAHYYKTNKEKVKWN